MSTGSTPQQALDINALLSNPSLLRTLELGRVETPEERASRLKREEGEAHQKIVIGYADLIRDNIITIAVLVSVGYVLSLFINIATTSTSADAQKAALAALTAFVGAAGGYIFGRRSAK